MKSKLNLNSLFKAMIAVFIMALITACSSSGEVEAPDDGKKLDPEAADHGRLGDLIERREQNPLAIPPDLISETNPELVANVEKQQSVQEVLPEIYGASIVTDAAGNEYVEVDANADIVWTRLIEYWADEGVLLERAEPKTGVIETEWVESVSGEEQSGPSGLFKEVFNRVTGDGVQFEKYHYQLARQEDKTRVYVSYRATAKEEFDNGLKKVSDFEWVQKSENPGKVREMMQIVVLLFEDVR